MRHLIATLVVMLVASAPARAQAPHASDARSVTGSYTQPGCALQVAPVAADTVRIQIECNRGAPSYNFGFLDERLPIHARTVVYSTAQSVGPCRISIAFRGDSATVTQDGSDITCGFGANVSVDGTYHRASREAPPFDLSPCG